ncbi:hypothetical protein KDH_69080 [Dictyobacter sp. S3.2.2.5]|uniref:Uncharacterized protein n=1 Tax=Dictyobacter halimunensis TaxID=3026934 RepID=A0ABQ6G0Q8_9CHLR|nr:hypothetical protein KDH_69080 [Dictyobacter sp. S3.2.2.5]
MNHNALLLHLYPRVWRDRYAEEMLEVLEARPLSMKDVLNVIFGACDAHLHPFWGTKGMPPHEKLLTMLRALRQSLIMIFSAYIGFVVGGLIFAKMTEDTVDATIRLSALAGASYWIVFFGSIIALAAIVMGGVPIALAIVKNAITLRKKGPLLLLLVPGLAFFALLLILRLNFAAMPGPASLSGFSAFFLLEAIISTAAVCMAVKRSQIKASTLRFATIPFLIAIITMLLMCCATICWGISLYSTDPALFIDQYSFMHANSLLLWLVVVGVMAISTVIALIAGVRGARAFARLNDTSALGAIEFRQ